MIVICDRANFTLQYLTMDGEYVETLADYGWPANVDTLGELMVVPETARSTDAARQRQPGGRSTGCRRRTN